MKMSVNQAVNLWQLIYNGEIEQLKAIMIFLDARIFIRLSSDADCLWNKMDRTKVANFLREFADSLEEI
jgi:hypothetical protein